MGYYVIIWEYDFALREYVTRTVGEYRNHSGAMRKYKSIGLSIDIIQKEIWKSDGDYDHRVAVEHCEGF